MARNIALGLALSGLLTMLAGLRRMTLGRGL